MPCPCRAVMLKIYNVYFPFEQHSATVFDSHIPRCEPAVLRPYRFASDLSRSWHGMGRARHGICELTSAVSRRSEGHLPRFGFFRLPRGVLRLTVRIFPVISGLSRRTRHCRRTAGTQHGMHEVARRGTAGARHGICVLAWIYDAECCDKALVWCSMIRLRKTDVFVFGFVCCPGVRVGWRKWFQWHCGTVPGVGRYLALLLVPLYCSNSCVSVYCRIECLEEIKHVSEVIINEHKMVVFVQYLRTVDLSETALKIPCWMYPLLTVLRPYWKVLNST
jgi:hypothetical protein